MKDFLQRTLIVTNVREHRPDCQRQIKAYRATWTCSFPSQSLSLVRFTRVNRNNLLSKKTPRGDLNVNNACWLGETNVRLFVGGWCWCWPSALESEGLSFARGTEGDDKRHWHYEDRVQSVELEARSGR